MAAANLEFFCLICYSPPRIPVANEGLQGFPYSPKKCQSSSWCRGLHLKGYESTNLFPSKLKTLSFGMHHFPKIIIATPRSISKNGGVFFGGPYKQGETTAVYPFVFGHLQGAPKLTPFLTISLDHSTTPAVPLHLQLIVVPDDCHLDRSGTSVEKLGIC